MKRYRVCGTQRVAGHEPGDEFSASYSQAHESYLIDGGHVVLVARKSASKSAPSQHEPPQESSGTHPDKSRRDA